MLSCSRANFVSLSHSLSLSLSHFLFSSGKSLYSHDTINWLLHAPPTSTRPLEEKRLLDRHINTGARRGVQAAIGQEVISGLGTLAHYIVFQNLLFIYSTLARAPIDFFRVLPKTMLTKDPVGLLLLLLLLLLVLRFGLVSALCLRNSSFQ